MFQVARAGCSGSLRSFVFLLFLLFLSGHSPCFLASSVGSSFDRVAGMPYIGIDDKGKKDNQRP